MGGNCCSSIIDPNRNNDGTVFSIFMKEILLSNQDVKSRKKNSFKPQ